MKGLESQIILLEIGLGELKTHGRNGNMSPLHGEDGGPIPSVSIVITCYNYASVEVEVSDTIVLWYSIPKAEVSLYIIIMTIIFIYYNY